MFNDSELTMIQSALDGCDLANTLAQHASQTVDGKVIGAFGGFFEVLRTVTETVYSVEIFASVRNRWNWSEGSAADWQKMCTDCGIRSYGPGKFETVLDAYVYSVTLDGGCDAEATANGEWCGLMVDGHSIFRDHDPLLESLTTAEHDKLTDCAGVIVYEQSDGFVGVTYYDHRSTLDAAWGELERLDESDAG